MTMTRRNLYLPDALWNELRAYAVDLSVEEGQQVSTSEAARRIFEAHLQEWREKK